jgi:hypothetical protein
MRLLPAYVLSRIIVALPSNGMFTQNLSPRERIYRVVAQQRVYISQYIYLFLCLLTTHCLQTPSSIGV